MRLLSKPCGGRLVHRGLWRYYVSRFEILASFFVCSKVPSFLKQYIFFTRPTLDCWGLGLTM